MTTLRRRYAGRAYGNGIEAQLHAIAERVRQRSCPVRAEPGQCEQVSDALVRALRDEGFRDVETVFGFYRGRIPHEWVRAGHWYIDATRDQFKGQPPIKIWRVNTRDTFGCPCRGHTCGHRSPLA